MSTEMMPFEGQVKWLVSKCREKRISSVVEKILVGCLGDSRNKDLYQDMFCFVHKRKSGSRTISELIRGIVLATGEQMEDILKKNILPVQNVRHVLRELTTDAPAWLLDLSKGQLAPLIAAVEIDLQRRVETNQADNASAEMVAWITRACRARKVSSIIERVLTECFGPAKNRDSYALVFEMLDSRKSAKKSIAELTEGILRSDNKEDFEKILKMRIFDVDSFRTVLAEITESREWTQAYAKGDLAQLMCKVEISLARKYPSTQVVNESLPIQAVIDDPCGQIFDQPERFKRLSSSFQGMLQQFFLEKGIPEEMRRVISTPIYLGDKSSLCNLKRLMTTLDAHHWIEANMPHLVKDYESCGVEWNIDHVLPKKWGGIDHPRNYVLLPRRLNAAFADKFDEKVAFYGRAIMREVAEFLQWAQFNASYDWSTLKKRHFD